jgi:ubiquinone/menaquinone biosynthesis C-methylase UbiE
MKHRFQVSGFSFQLSAFSISPNFHLPSAISQLPSAKLILTPPDLRRTLAVSQKTMGFNMSSLKTITANMPDYIDINRLAYEALSDDYSRRAIIRSKFEEAPENLARAAFSACNTTTTTKIALEIGPGSGDIIQLFSKWNAITLAVELASKVIETSRQRSPATIFIQDNILNVHFIENQFDIIYAGAVIHLFPKDDAIKLLSLFYSWLKPKGAFFVNTTMSETPSEGLEVKADYSKSVTRFRKRWTEAELVTAVRNAGFEIINTLYTDEQDRSKHWIALVCTKNS